jgi:glutaredoxin 2
MEPAKKTIFISNGNTKIPFEVTTFVGDDGQTHLNITGTKNGVQVPLPGTNSGIPGWFNGTEDFIDYIKKSTQK